MNTIKQIQQEIIEDFSLFGDWMEKYEYIIDLGKNLSPVEDNLKKEEFLIPGCQSRVWLIPEFKNNKLHFLADSDAIITKGIVSMLLRVFNARTPEKKFQIQNYSLSMKLI